MNLNFINRINITPNRNALAVYTNRVFRIVVLLLPAISTVAGVFFTYGKCFGLYEPINTIGIIVFDVVCVAYWAISLFYYKTSFDDHENLIPGKLKSGKIMFVLLVCFQWNYLSYLVPSRDFWGYAPFFLLLTAVFFDRLMVASEMVLLSVSIIISWVIRGSALLPGTDDFYVANIMLRIIGLILSFGTIYLMTWLCNTLLVRELEMLSDYDSMTRVLNRRSMDTVLAKAHEGAKNGRPYALAMLDLDDFKLVNDTYGHEYGDKVLKRFAELLSHGVKNGDHIFRYGGEEFLIHFDCAGECAVRACERMLKTVGDEVFSPMPGVNLHISFTAGVAEYRPGRGIQDVLHLADSSMYEGKRNGKAQVRFEE